MKILDVPQSGSTAGITSSRNRFGQYRRTRAVPVQPRTPKQTSNRSFFTNGSSSWRGLSDADRTAWNDYAAQISRSDSLGSGYNPTGASLMVGACIILNTPSALAPLELPNYFLSISGMTYTDPTPGPEALTVALVTTGSNNSFTIETSGPVSPGITSAAAVRRWRSLPGSSANLNEMQYGMNTTPVAILTQYKYLFPSPASGQTIWFRFREIFYDSTGLTAVTNRTAQTFRLVIP